jgi:hypothetical protein
MKKLMVLALVAVTLTSCSSSNDCPQSLPVLEAEQVAGAVPMPAPAPRPAPPPPRPAPAPKAPAPQPAAPKPAAPKPAAPKPAPKPYTPPPIYRPTDRYMNRNSPNYNYHTVYVNHQVDHTPLLWMIAMNGMMSNSHHTQECNA